MNGWMAFLSILAVVAIIVVAAGIIVAIGHMIIGAFDTDKKEAKESSEDYKLEDSNVNTYSATNEYDFDAINQAKAEEEKSLVEAESDEEFKLDEAEDEDISAIEENLKKGKQEVETEVEPETEEDDDLDDVDDLLEDISNEVVDSEKDKAAEAAAPSEELENYNIDSYLEEEEEDKGEETEETEEIEETVEEVVEENNNENNEELAASKQEIEALKAQLEAVNKQLAEAMNNKTEVVTIDMTEEACLERIAVLEERLKNVKAEYKVNMKEYRPLRKVKNTLERDKVKLRRRDAIVAKKKIDLYGVANIVDMDKEKAAKLADEIELLDGLRLSVRHCEEVMEANKERFPILEHTNKILEDQIAQIEEDITSTKATLQAIRDKKGSGEGEGENDAE